MALARLAVLDSSEPPAQPMLVAEVDGELRAALSLRDWNVVADPFLPTAALVDLLRARAEQLVSDAALRSAPEPWRARLGLARPTRFRGNA